LLDWQSCAAAGNRLSSPIDSLKKKTAPLGAVFVSALTLDQRQLL